MPLDNGSYSVRTPDEIEADRDQLGSLCQRCGGEIPHGGTCGGCGCEASTYRPARSLWPASAGLPPEQRVLRGHRDENGIFREDPLDMGHAEVRRAQGLPDPYGDEEPF